MNERSVKSRNKLKSIKNSLKIRNEPSYSFQKFDYYAKYMKTKKNDHTKSNKASLQLDILNVVNDI